MMNWTFAFDPPAVPSLPIRGAELLFPVRRIYCVGRNYAAHAREMGGNPDREPPFFFSKPADAVTGGGELSFPLATEDLHHEVELVIAVAGQGSNLSPEACRELIYGYAVGVDLTRRDLQREARDHGRPWDMAKGFDRSAPCSPIAPVSEVGHPRSGAIGLEVNGRVRQHADISELIWSPEEILVHLSKLVTLTPGDLVFTGTPAGVGPLVRGDEYRAWVAGVGQIAGRVAAS